MYIEKLLDKNISYRNIKIRCLISKITQPYQAFHSKYQLIWEVYHLASYYVCAKLKKYYLIFIFSYIFNIFVIYSSISQFLETSVCISHPVTISGVLAYFGISNMKGLLLFLSRLWNKEISCFQFLSIFFQINIIK